MKLRLPNRCSICNAIIPDDKKLCPICEEYHPCGSCQNKTTAQCMCRKWKTWFGLQWSQFRKKDNRSQNS